LAIYAFDLVVGLEREFGEIGVRNGDEFRLIAHGRPFTREQRILVAVADAEVSAWAEALPNDRKQAIGMSDR